MKQDFAKNFIKGKLFPRDFLGFLFCCRIRKF